MLDPELPELMRASSSSDAGANLSYSAGPSMLPQWADQSYILLYTKKNENHQNWRFFFNPVSSEITRFCPSLQVSSKKPGFSQSCNFCDFAKWCLIFVQPFKIMMHSICIAHSCAPCNTPSFLAFSRSRNRLQPNAGAWPPKCVQAHGESPAAVHPSRKARLLSNEIFTNLNRIRKRWNHWTTCFRAFHKNMVHHVWFGHEGP